MPRARAERPPTRKREAPVTRAFLFSDLREYTAFVEAHGDAAAAKLIHDYRALVRREVARHRGAEVKTEGDSFYVVFDSSLAALQCAVTILRAAEARRPVDPGSMLRIGIGLHAGEVVPHDRQYVGSAVNIAARLASKAEAGELLVSDTFRGLVRTAQTHPMSDRGALRLKGIAERVRAWSVTWREAPLAAPAVAEPLLFPTPTAHLPAPTGQLLCPVVIGRDAELGRVRERIELTATGAGQTIVLGGDAGAGKSAFARRAQELASERGFRLLTGLTHESDVGLPYAPFISAVRSGFRGLEHDRLGRFLQQVAPDLAQLFAELGRITSRAEPPTELERRRLSVAFQRLFNAFGREAPVLLVLEDLHWADEASLELLQHLAREIRDVRALVLATYRSDELHRRHPFLRTLAALQRERLVTTIQLQRLTREEVADLIRLTMRLPRAPTPEFLDAIHARCEGNPFFTEELLKALAESGQIFFSQELGHWTRGGTPVAELKIPDTIVDAVRARVERLTPAARATLNAAAVVGLRFPFEVLLTVLGVDEAEVEAHLREFIDLQLVAEAARDAEEYAFRHALTREVVYDDVFVRERKRLHRAVAEALERRPDTEPSLLAHHLLAAGEQQRALPHLLAAAERAFRAYAPREAVAHWEKALGIGIGEERLADTLERMFLAYRMFDVVRATSVGEEALRLRRASGDVKAISRMLRELSVTWGARGEGARQRALLQEAIDVLRDAGECLELGQALVRQSGLRLLDGDYPESVALAQRAIALGERFGDPWTVAAGTIRKGSALGRVAPEGSEAVLRRGIDLAVAGGFVSDALTGYNNLAVSFIGLARPVAEREALLKEAIAYGRRHGAELQANLPHLLAGIRFQRGDWEEALEIFRQYREVDPREHMGMEAAVAAAREGPRAALSLVLKNAEAALRQQEGQTVVPWCATAAFTCASAGDDDEARVWLERLRERVDADEAAREFLGSSWGVTPLLLATLRLGVEHEWLPPILASAARRPDPLQEAALHAIGAAQAVADGDPQEAVRRVLAMQGIFARVGLEIGWSSYARSLAVEAQRRGLGLGSEWRPILDRVRALAERAGARAWLQELDGLVLS